MSEALERLVETARSPRAAMEAYLAAGKKVAGCIPEYTPEPLLHAAGYIPFGMWGGQTAIMRADAYLPTFACSLVRSCAELGLGGAYKGLSLIVAPILCDALKGCVQTFRVAVKDPPIFPFSLPQNRALPSAGAFAEGEFRALKGKLEALSGEPISDAALAHSIQVYNDHARAMRAFDAAAADHTDLITPSVRQAVYKSAWFMEKGEHAALVRALTQELSQQPVCRKRPLRVVLTGVTSGSPALMSILEEEGFDVVGDLVYQDNWRYRQDFPDAPAPLTSLALHWLRVGQSCVCHEPRRSRAANLLELVGQRQANAVLLCLMKFCDPEEYEAPQLTAQVRLVCPILTLDIDQNSDNLEQLRTRLQSFRELLEQ